jgi:hypothetical protein
MTFKAMTCLHGLIKIQNKCFRTSTGNPWQHKD